MTRWRRKPAAPWQFWLPQSGILGGFIGGAVLALIVYLCKTLL